MNDALQGDAVPVPAALSAEGLRPIAVHLRDTRTGEATVYYDDGWWTDGAFSDFIWSEGNYSCDCNRFLFLKRAQGCEEPADDEGPCGDGGIAIDRIVDLTTGTTVYTETLPPE
jgi:hypothetical protein